MEPVGVVGRAHPAWLSSIHVIPAYAGIQGKGEVRIFSAWRQAGDALQSAETWRLFTHKLPLVGGTPAHGTYWACFSSLYYRE